MLRLLVLVCALAVLVPVSHAAIGRGGLASWGDLAGEWTGTGETPAGPCTVTATVESIFGGRYLLVWLRELRNGSPEREDLSVYATIGDRLSMHLHDSTGQSWNEFGTFDVMSRELLVSGNGFVRVLRRAGGRIEGLWQVAAGRGLVDRLRFSLARGSANATPAAAAKGIDAIEFLQGDFKGKRTFSGGENEVSESCKAVLNYRFQVARQTQTRAQGSTASFLIVWGESCGQLFRHVYADDGQIVEFTGQGLEIGKAVFKTPFDGGTIVYNVGST